MVDGLLVNARLLNRPRSRPRRRPRFSSSCLFRERERRRGRLVFGAVKRFFNRPNIGAIALAVAMGGEESAAVLPEQRPDLFEIGLRQVQVGQRGPGKKLKVPFSMSRWQGSEAWLYLEQEH